MCNLPLQLGFRLAHVLRRLLSIAMYLLQRDGQLPGGQDFFLRRVSTSFGSFIDEVRLKGRLVR